MRGALAAARGDVLLPLTDIPHYRQIFVLRSGDGGRNWEKPVLAAVKEGSEFEGAPYDPAIERPAPDADARQWYTASAFGLLRG